jgi:SAM-dependent methyltransferase
MLKRTIRRVRKLVAGIQLGGHEVAKIVWNGFRISLDRAPRPEEEKTYTAALMAGRLSPSEFLSELTKSVEYAERGGPRQASPLHYLHAARVMMVKMLPKAETIVDLGGGAHETPVGAMVLMGYPYEFDTLTIVEPPQAARHDLYKNLAPGDPVEFDTGRGLVKYLYTSLGDLSAVPSGSVDLVFSGESFEHVTREEGERVLAETRRMLKPTGSFCFDTPNRAVTRTQVGDREFINPDHKYEYTHSEMTDLLRRHGLEIVEQKGITWCPTARRTGRFDLGEMIANVGLYDDVEDCYLLYYRCRPRG